jgi:hypothetical protein
MILIPEKCLTSMGTNFEVVDHGLACAQNARRTVIPFSGDTEDIHVARSAARDYSKNHPLSDVTVEEYRGTRIVHAELHQGERLESAMGLEARRYGP